MPEYYRVGKLVNTHGVRGEMRVIVTTDFPDERFVVGQQLYIDDAAKTPVVINSVRQHKGFTLVTFENYTDINQVLPFKTHDLLVADEDLQPLDDGEYYYRDLIGLTVIDQDNQVLGKVSEILSPGANDVWVIPRKGKSDILLPF